MTHIQSVIVTVSGVKVGRTVRLSPYRARTITLHPTGAKLRALRRALGAGPLNARVTARTVAGRSLVQTNVRVTG